jgi:hypothetical protein
MRATCDEEASCRLNRTVIHSRRIASRGLTKKEADEMVDGLEEQAKRLCGDVFFEIHKEGEKEIDELHPWILDEVTQGRCKRCFAVRHYYGPFVDYGIFVEIHKYCKEESDD